MLIQCPKCGKPVSDQAKECIHCRYPLGVPTPKTELAQEKSTQPLIDYAILSAGEKKELVNRFGIEYPEAAAVIKKGKFLYKGVAVFVIVTILLTLCLMAICIPFSEGNEAFMQYETTAIIFSVLTLAVVILLLITAIVFAVLQMLNRSKEAEAYPVFAKWASERNILNVSFPAYIKSKN